MKGSVRERFLLKYRVDEVSGCWDWLGAKNNSGYGSFGKSALAHRVSYELFIGPIPEGLCLDHLCRNRGCVNPEHLEAVTAQVNLLRSPRRNAGLMTHVKAIEAEVTEIQRLVAMLVATVRPAPRKGQRECGDRN